VAIAKAAGVQASTVGRWADGGGVDPAQAARLARHYGHPVLEAFVEAGFLTEEEARVRITRAEVGLLDNDELVAEISRRLERSRPDITLLHRAHVQDREPLTDLAGHVAPTQPSAGESAPSVADQVEASARLAFADESEDEPRR